MQSAIIAAPDFTTSINSTSLFNQMHAVILLDFCCPVYWQNEVSCSYRNVTLENINTTLILKLLNKLMVIYVNFYLCMVSLRILTFKASTQKLLLPLPQACYNTFTVNVWQIFS